MSTVDFHSVAFAGAIRETAAALGREPTAEQIGALENVLRQAAVLGADNQVTVMTDAGAMLVPDYIAQSLAHLPLAAVPAGAKTPTATIVDEPLSSVGRDDLFGELSRRWAHSRSESALKDALAHGNPWQRGRENRTRQCIIANTNPALAAEMKIKAGAN